LYGPEFTLYDGERALRRADFVYQIVYGGGTGSDSSVAGSTGTSVDLQQFAGSSESTALLDRCNLLLMRGALSASARQALAAAIDQHPADATLERLRSVIYLLGQIPQFQVQR
jgi:hypothetical protein